MEVQKKNRREWVKTAVIIFLVIMLILTFFSNTIMNRSLPEVAAQYVQSGTINARIRGSGTISANETYDVTLNQTRKVRSVLVKVGQTVAEGDVLFTLEAMESDELKQAQDTLEQMELDYQKSLISASNEASTENRNIQMLRDDYNEALALYNQYSTVDTSRIQQELARAERELKELEAIQKDAQKAYDARGTEKADLQARVSELEVRVTELRTILDKQAEVEDAEDTLREDEHRYLQDYYKMLELAGQDEDLAMSYARYPEQLPMDNAEDLATAYITIVTDQENIAAREEELNRLLEDTVGIDDVDEAEDEYDSIFHVYEDALRELDYFDSVTEIIQRDLEAAMENVTAQNDLISELNKAVGAADSVKAAKEALETALFEQSLGDASSLDYQAAKAAIEEQKALIEELSANADGQDVKASVPGVISAINVTAGNTAGAEMPIATITVADRGYTVQIPVTMEQARQVKIGDLAEVTNFWNGSLTATLENIANDPQNIGKGKLLIFRLTGDGAEAGMNLTLSIGQRSANYDTLIPNSAVRSDANGSFVLVVVAKSSPLGNRYIATRADVQVLASDDTTSAVSGLANGDFVITTSTIPIEAGNQVRLVDNG